MPTAPIFVAVEGAQELKALRARLKAAKRVDLQRKLREKIKDAGNPVVKDIRAAVMDLKVTRGSDPYARRSQSVGNPGPGSDKRSTGLRARTARAVGISQTRKGIRIKVSAKKFGDYGVTLPRRMDAELPRWRRWRHPAFGNMEVWVEQRGSNWFLSTIRHHRPAFRKAVFAAMDEVGKELTGQ